MGGGVAGRGHRRQLADSCPALVAPGTAVGAPVDLGRVDERVDRGCRARGTRTRRTTPAVARGVDEHADGRGEPGGRQARVHVGRERGLVDVGVVLVEGARHHRLPADERGPGEVRLLDRRVVGGVTDEAIHAGGLGRRHVGDLHELGGGTAGVVGPAEPTGVRHVQVRVHVGDRVQLVQGVGHALLVERGRRRARRDARVGRDVRQRVGLDDGHDAQVGVLRVRQRRRDRVDVLGLVRGQAGLRRRQLTVGSQRVAVPSRQVIDDDLDGLRCGILLCQRPVEVSDQTQTAVRAGDGGPSVHPHGRRGVADRAHLRRESRIGRRSRLRLHARLPRRVHILRSTHIRIVLMRFGCLSRADRCHHDAGHEGHR